jgi:ATP adenylyltransferase
MGMLGYIATATQNEISNWMQLGLTETLGQLGVPKEV